MHQTMKRARFFFFQVGNEYLFSLLCVILLFCLLQLSCWCVWREEQKEQAASASKRIRGRWKKYPLNRQFQYLDCQIAHTRFSFYEDPDMARLSNKRFNNQGKLIYRKKALPLEVVLPFAWKLNNNNNNLLATGSMMFNWLQSSLCSAPLSLSLSLLYDLSQTAILSHADIHLPWWVRGHRRKRLSRKTLIRAKWLVPVIVMPLLLILFCKMLFVTWEINGHIIKWSSSYMCLNISDVCCLTFDVNKMTLWTRSSEREREEERERERTKAQTRFISKCM